MRARRSCALLLGLLLCCLVRPSLAQAHARLVASYPPDGSVQATPPTTVHLWFSEPVQPVGEALIVLDPSGKRVALGPLKSNGQELWAALSARAPGAYLVVWQVISLDTHPARGRFSFNVGHPGIVPGTPGFATGSPLGLALQVLARWLHLAGYALGFGPFAFDLLVLSAPRSGAVSRRLWWLADIGILLLVLAEPVALLAQTASLGSGSLWDFDIAGDALSSSFGRVLAQRLGCALALWTLLGLARQGSARAVRATLVLGLALALIDGEASHAISSGPLWLGLPANALHVAAMGVWAGGLASLLAVSGLEELQGRRMAVVVRFGGLAVVSLALLTVSGLIMAFLHLARPGNLAATAYGRVLAAKALLALAAPLLALAGRRAVRQRQERWWGLEGLALLGVLALAGLLVSLPPPA